MSVRTDVINLNVNVNGNKAQDELNKLRKRAADVKFEMEGLKKGTAEYIAKSKELSQINAQMASLKKEIGITALTQKELIAELNKLKSLRGSVIPFSAEFKDLSKQIRNVEDRLYDVRNGVQGFSSFFSKIKDEVKQFGVLAAGYLGFEFITNSFQNVIRNSGKLSDQLADLQRVAGLTSKEAIALNNSFKELNTRTSTEGLREIAIIAGKLGVAKGDILEFTKAVDQLVVSLGDELGSAEEITDQLGKILNVFNGEISATGISQLGNAFVELANTGSATGKFIADFDQRLSGIAKSSGISLGALSGLGAGLEEMGARVESSSTAIQKLIVNIASDIPKAAKIAGLSTNQFSQLFKKDATEALLKYSEGLVKNKGSFEEVTRSLADAGEEGARTIEVISKLGTSSDQLRKRIDLGKTSIQETTAITEAFNLKNETFGATLDRVGKEFNKLISSSAVTGFIQGLTKSFLSFLQALGKAPQFFRDNAAGITLIITGIAIMNASLIKSGVLILRDTYLKIANAAATRGTAVATAIAEVAQASYITVVSLLTGRITLATAAQRLWNIAMSVGLGPIGLIITAVGALVLAFAAYNSKLTTANAEQKAQVELAKRASEAYADQVNSVERLKSILLSENASLEAKKKAYQALIDINPEFQKTLILDEQGHIKGKEAIDQYIESLKRKGEVQAATELSNEINKKILEKQLEKDNVSDQRAGSSIFGSLVGKRSAKDVQNIKNQIQSDIDALQAQKKFFDDKIKKLFEVPEAGAGGGTVAGELAKSTGKTIAQLREEIKKLDEAYENIDISNKKALQSNRAAREALQRQLDALEGKKEKKTSDQSEYARILQDAKKFQAELKRLKQRTDEGETPEDQEIVKAKQKYEQLLARAKEYYLKHAISRDQFNADEKIIAEAQQKELNEIFQKYYKQRMELAASSEYDSAQNASAEFYDNLRAQQARLYADGKLSKVEYENSLKDIEKRESANRIQIAEDYSKTVKQAATDVVKFKKDAGKQETKDLIEETNARLKLRAEEKDAQLTRNVRKAERAVGPGDPYASTGYIDAVKEQLKREKEIKIQAKKDEYEELGITLEEGNAVLLEIEEEYQAKVADLDQRHVQSKIAQFQTYVGYVQQALTSLNTYINNKENAQFQKEKALNDRKKKEYKAQLDNKLISQAQYDKKINALQEEQDKKERELKRKQAKREKALNLFRAIVNVAAGVASSLSYGGPVGIALAAITAVLGALEIAAIASEPLPEAAKGKYYANGKKHSQGGIPIEIEQGEAVMMAAAMDDKNRYTVSGTPKQITSALNSQAGGESWAGGAVIKKMPYLTEKPASLNPNLPRFAGGGIVRPINQEKTESLNDRIVFLLEELIREGKANTEEIRTMKKTLKAVVSIKEFRDAEKLYDDSKTLSGLGKTGS